MAPPLGTSIVTAMATQSLYRRYRPRRFSEVRGQDHVVKALRTSVAEGREGQAYLFSGPRGTGKTTSARILAKVLNCTNAQDGEPCCECESCLSVERGTSYDVHELDAASNNGVDAMRDLIDKASLGTPGRHKVYILDEVHMLTKPAEAALLKTLEEPPPHVVFVLATTDPQKMSDTIRSRTQHLQFHLLPSDTLQQHIRWVADDAGLVVSDAAIEQVLAQGAGSARDALSALELVANTGGEGAETVPIDEFVEAMIERDPGRALKMAAGAIGLGRDPRTLTEELVAFLRNGFLSIMSPELVQLPSDRVAALSEQSQRLGAAGLVRGIEHLGEALTEMRHAPDPRVLLDVAIVKLTSDSAAAGDASAAVSALTARVAKLEKQLADGVPAAAQSPGVQASPAAAVAVGAVAETPRDDTTGRATLGGRARRTLPAESNSPGQTQPTVAAAETTPDSATVPTPAQSEPTRSQPVPVDSAPPSNDSAMSQAMWDDTVKPALRGMTRAVFSPAAYVSNTDSVLTLSLPNPVHRDKCEQHREAVEQALAAATGGPVALELVLAGGGGPDTSVSSSGGPAGGSAAAVAPTAAADPTSPPSTASARSANESPMDPGHPAANPQADSVMADGDAPVDEMAPQRPTESPRRAAERKAAEAEANGTPLQSDGDLPGAAAADIDVLPEDHEVDLTELVDAPPESVKTPIDRLAEAFPGSELVTETY
jgi:DNA polymerase-3 subunit gamma/tau